MVRRLSPQALPASTDCTFTADCVKQSHAGRCAQVFIYGMHHSHKYWDEPDAFRPERWLAPTPAAAKPSKSGRTAQHAANVHANGVASGYSNGHANGFADGHASVTVNAHAIGTAKGYTNGHAGAVSNGRADGAANGHANGHAHGTTNGYASGHAGGACKPDAAGSETKSTKWMSAAADVTDGRKAAFLPFSGGPLDCIGQRLAMMQVRFPGSSHKP